MQQIISSLLIGSLVGLITLTSNFYMGLKLGWAISPTLLSTILTHIVYKSTNNKLSIKSHCLAVTCSTAIGALSIGFTSSLPVLFRLNLLQFNINNLLVDNLLFLINWSISASFFGLFLAVPIASYFINKLPFPSSSAAAKTIIDFNIESDIKPPILPLISSLLFSFCFKSIGCFLPIINRIHILYYIGKSNRFISDLDLIWRWVIQITPAFFGVGLIVGKATAVSYFLGALLSWGIIGPIFFELKVAKKINIWIGVCILVASNFGELINRLYKIYYKAKREQNNSVSETEEDNNINISKLIWIAGLTISILLTLCLTTFQLNIPILTSILALIVSIILGLIGCQTFGAVDINPIGVIGKLTQLIFSILPNTNLTSSLIAGAIASSCAAQSADMVADFKLGQILKIKPKYQLYTQIFGSILGIIFSNILFLLFSSAYPCILDGSESCLFDTPAVNAWLIVTKGLSNGNFGLPRVGWVLCGICFVVSFFSSLFGFRLRWSAVGVSFLSPDPSLAVAMLMGSMFNGFEIGKIVAGGFIAGEGLGSIFLMMLTLGGLDRERYAVVFGCPNEKLVTC